VSKKCIVVYDNPSMWMADVMNSDNPNLEEAKRDLCPYYLWNGRNTEEDVEPFAIEEIESIRQSEPANGSILVREENVGGIFAYRKIVAGGELVPGFCDLHFNLDEVKVRVLVSEFLANLGASEISVKIKRVTEETISEKKETDSKASGKSPVADGDVETKTNRDKSSMANESVVTEGYSQTNEPDFEAARFVLKSNAWFANYFSGLYERVRSGRTHGVQTDTIEHHVSRDFYKNSAFAVGVAVRYNMVRGELQTKVDTERKSHKDEMVSLTWSCSFP